MIEEVCGIIGVYVFVLGYDFLGMFDMFEVGDEVLVM